jgi:formyl-CoA transferase
MVTPGVGDSGSGLHAAIGILAALHKRERTGVGQMVEISMQDSVVNLMRMFLTRTLGHGIDHKRQGHQGTRGLPMVFPCAPGGSNDYVMIHPRGDGWDLMLAAIDRPELIGDPRFDDEEERVRNSKAATEIITGWTSQRTKWEAMDTLAGAGVLSGATIGAAEVLENEHLIAREMIVNVADDVRGDYKMIGIPIKLSEEANAVTRAPRYSEHTDEVLKTVLGCSSEDIEQMRQQGVIV